jgi:hypothetical protein
VLIIPEISVATAQQPIKIDAMPIAAALTLLISTLMFSFTTLVSLVTAALFFISLSHEFVHA